MNGTENDLDRTDHEAARDLPPRLAKDRFYQALASSHRRRLLYYLLASGDSTVEELTSVLTGWDATTSGTMRTPRDRANVRIRLLHDHLPRLADQGLIEYDADTETVALASLHGGVEDVIRRSIEAERFTDSG